MQYQLRGLTQSVRGLAFAIAPDHPMILGRQTGADILVNDPTISRRHCILHQKATVLVVRDENSTTGSYLNGVRLGRADHVLNPRDILQVGKVAFLVEVVTHELEADTPIYVPVRDS